MQFSASLILLATIFISTIHAWEISPGIKGTNLVHSLSSKFRSARPSSPHSEDLSSNLPHIEWDTLKEKWVLHDTTFPYTPQQYRDSAELFNQMKNNGSRDKLQSILDAYRKGDKEPPEGVSPEEYKTISIYVKAQDAANEAEAAGRVVKGQDVAHEAEAEGHAQEQHTEPEASSSGVVH
ncbi:hypothetical protein BC835DRAFT_1364531 [Cytidiella melzeri]|nr:hypothetical protein BC835DRAFT_1364531 [Cytidiella melzeri]